MSNLPANRPQSAPAAPAATNRRIDLAQAITPANYKTSMEFATMLSRSGLCPRGYQGKPEDILVCMMMGAELGVSHLQALKGIAVINGVATVWGDLGIGLVLNSNQLEYLTESWDNKTQTATIRIKRKGYPEHIETFSMDDARRVPYTERDRQSGRDKPGIKTLADKDTYRAWPQRMCGFKAKRFACRKEFADKLCGLEFAEDRMDMIAPTPPPLEIQMPREIGAPVPQAEIDEQRLEDDPRYETMDGPPEPDQEGDIKIYVVSAERKEYEEKDRKTKQPTGKMKEYYVLEFSDGKVCNTFSKTYYELAHDAGPSCKPVHYTAKEGKKYLDAEGIERQQWNLATLAIVGPEQAPSPVAEPPE